MDHRVLYVAYEFPPVGGAGVQRTAKFVKYLPSFGWNPSVLTVSNPSVPTIDETLCKDIPACAHIVRCPTWEPCYRLKATASEADSELSLMGVTRRYVKRIARTVVNSILLPDPQILWAPAAMSAGRQLLKTIPHQAIIATGPPFSSFVIGHRLSRKSGLPLILDYRDEWSISNKHRENRSTFGPIKWRQHRQEMRILNHASAVLATTRASAEAIREICKKSNSKAKVFEIYNGYDPDDFNLISPPELSDETFRISYIGTLWNLTSVTPIVEAVKAMCKQQPHLTSRLELVFAGRRTAAQDALLDSLNELPVRLVRKPYLPHNEAIRLMKSSSLLCLLLSESTESPRVVPAKLFEYLAARRPILAIAPHGEVWDLLNAYPAVHRIIPSDVTFLAEMLLKKLAEFIPSERKVDVDWDISKFSRVTQAEALAKILSTSADLCSLGSFSSRIQGSLAEIGEAK